MNNLSNLKSIKTIKSSRRLGRGSGSTKGGTSGRGNKGYKARSGSNSRLAFEGGQMPLVARIPKLKGFKAIKTNYKVFNVGELEGLAEKGVIDKKILIQKGLTRRGYKVKILGEGEIATALRIEADGFSGSAKEKIEKAGGTALLITDKKDIEKKAK